MRALFSAAMTYNRRARAHKATRPEEQLKEAVSRVGTSAEKVREALRK